MREAIENYPGLLICGAGNIGNPLYINLTIVDKEAPVFVGFRSV